VRRERITVLLADDHALFREGVAEMLRAEDDLRVVGEAADGYDAVELVERELPDVVLLDVEMRGPGPEETLRRMLSASPSTRVVVLTMHDEPRLVRSLLGLGARAYVVKNATREELLATVRMVERDSDRVVLSVSRDTLERLEGRDEGLLSTRELEVLAFVATGLSNARIAAQLHIAEGTVKRHLTNVYAKLGVASRMDAVNKAVSAGLVNPRGPPDAAVPGPSPGGRENP
jgi:DNA-binding NarL/FixJ family response regulator